MSLKTLFFILCLIEYAALGQVHLDSIHTIIEKEVNNKRSKSIIVGIVDSNGRHIVRAGIISDVNPIPPDGNTIYEIGSITKVFTSLLLADMSLKQELQLKDPISRFLPEMVKTPTRNGKEIALLHLATNRSGLPRNPYNLDPQIWDNPFAHYTYKELYEFLSHTELDRGIDSIWRYSNIGYALLGHILTLVGHEELGSLIHHNICHLLEMRSTFLSVPQDLQQYLAPGHSECGRPTSSWDFPLAGGGGLRSSINDMFIFAEANLGFTKTAIFPAMELCHVKQGKKDGNDGYVTMGWTLWSNNGQNIIFKDGGTGGYRSFLGIDKNKKYAVIVMSNTNNSITDIGLHILDSTYRINDYQYPWQLLDTLRDKVQTRGVRAGISQYHRLKGSGNKAFVFNEYQLNYLGNELRAAGKINDAIAIYQLNMKEYPQSVLVYESLGETYRRNRMKRKALDYFEKARALEPQNMHWSYIISLIHGGGT